MFVSGEVENGGGVPGIAHGHFWDSSWQRSTNIPYIHLRAPKAQGESLVWLTERIGGDIVLIGKVRRPRVVRQRRRRKGLGG